MAGAGVTRSVRAAGVALRRPRVVVRRGRSEPGPAALSARAGGGAASRARSRPETAFSRPTPCRRFLQPENAASLTAAALRPMPVSDRLNRCPNDTWVRRRMARKSRVRMRMIEPVPAEVLGEQAREPSPEVAAGPERSDGVEGGERQSEEGGGAGEGQPQAHRADVRPLDGPAPEVVPAEHQEREREQVRAEPDELKGQLGDERAHASREVHGRLVPGGAEEPDRIGRIVGGEGDEREQRGGEEPHPEELAQPA